MPHLRQSSISGLVSRITKKYVSREVLGSNPTGAVSNLGQVRHSRDASSLSEKDGSRSHTKGGRLGGILT